MSARPNSVLCVGAAVRRDDRVPEPSWLGLVLLCKHVSGEPRGDGHGDGEYALPAGHTERGWG